MFPRDLRQPSSFYYTNISERHLLLCVTTAVVSLMLHDCVYGLFLFLHLYLFHLLFLFLYQQPQKQQLNQTTQRLYELYTTVQYV